MGLFDKLKQGLQKTKQLLQTDVRDLFRAGEILDEAKLEAFEARLIRTDMGVAAAGEDRRRTAGQASRPHGRRAGTLGDGQEHAEGSAQGERRRRSGIRISPSRRSNSPPKNRR